MLTFWQQCVLAFLGWIVVHWLVRHVALFWILPRMEVVGLDAPRFAGIRDPAGVVVYPRVTAIIPAKDEEAVLSGCLESVLAQDYPDLEVLVVNDRSRDRTGAIAEAVAARDSRVKVLNMTTLPPGWTGKTHALHNAFSHVRSDCEWLWFLDADTLQSPECLSIIMAQAAEKHACLVSLLPMQRCVTFWENVIQPLAGIVLMRSFPLAKVNNPLSPAAFANGQFILIKRDAYVRAGGHAGVRDRFVEDIYLAREVKKQGGILRVTLARDISSTRMYTNLGQILRGWTRILYDAEDRRIAPFLHKLLDPITFTHPGHLALIVGLVWTCLGVPAADRPFAAGLLVLGCAHWLVSSTVMWRMYRLNNPRRHCLLWVLLYPLASLMADWIFLRSIRMCLTGKVVWRDTAYGGATCASASRSESANPS